MPQPAKPAKVLTGEATETAEAEADESSAFTPDRPFVIYVTDPNANTKHVDNIEKVIFDDDRIQLGTKAFTMVKMAPESAAADPVLKEKGGKEVPRLIFVSHDLKSVKAVEGNALKVSEVWSTMKSVSDKAYKQNLDTIVKESLKVLIEYDKIANERKVLEDKETRLADKATPADRKDIEAKRAELDARQEKAQAKREKLFELTLKGEKAKSVAKAE